MGRNVNYVVGSKHSCYRKISKKLDKKIRDKQKELKSSSKTPEKVTYIYASKMLEVKKWIKKDK